MFEIPITTHIGSDPVHIPVKIRRRESEKDETEEKRRDERRPPSETGNLLDIEV